MTLGQRIQEERKRLGLSQEGLGERLGVSRQAISKWEADGAVPEVDKLIALGRLFGVSLNELLQVDCPADTPEEEARSAEEYTRKARRRLVLKDAGHALTAVLVAVLVGAVAILWFRVGRLERALTAAKTPALNVAAQMVSAFDVRAEYGAVTSMGTVVNLAMNMLPTQSVEGMTVTFQATAGTYSELIPAVTSGEGTAYSAIHTFERSPEGMTLFAIFDDGIHRYTQPLAQITQVYVDKESSYLQWTPLWEAE